MMCKKIILMIFGLALVSTAYAAPTEPNALWVGGTGTWAFGGNWQRGVVPNDANGVIIDSSPDYNSLDMAIAVSIGDGESGAAVRYL
ncbi:MAG: hypothetical protein ACYTBV_14995 [Planctomycetota bacterium]|jgi:hypothetical protein